MSGGISSFLLSALESSLVECPLFTSLLFVGSLVEADTAFSSGVVSSKTTVVNGGATT